MTTPALLVSARLSLRALEPSDLDAVARWENDVAAWDYSDNLAPISRHRIEEYINRYCADPFAEGELRLMIVTADGAPAGMVDLYRVSALHARAFVGIYVAPEMRGRGVASEALRLLADYCRHRLGLRSLAALITADNADSAALFSRLGFRQTGRMESWRRVGLSFVDMLLFQLMLR